MTVQTDRQTDRQNHAANHEVHRHHIFLNQLIKLHACSLCWADSISMSKCIVCCLFAKLSWGCLRLKIRNCNQCKQLHPGPRSVWSWRIYILKSQPWEVECEGCRCRHLHTPLTVSTRLISHHWFALTPSSLCNCSTHTPPPPHLPPPTPHTHTHPTAPGFLSDSFKN